MSRNVILFVCTANQCRSPMAEYLMKARLGDDPRWEVKSAGTVACDGAPASRSAVQAMADLGIDAAGHVSSALSRELVDSSCIIVAMTRTHMDMIVAEFPDAADRCFLMGSFAADDNVEDVVDPVGMSVDVYRSTRDEIAGRLGHLIAFLEKYDTCD